MSKIIPFSQGSIVLLTREKCKYIIDEVNFELGRPTEYSLLGHKNIQSAKLGIAWIYHEDLKLLELPTYRSWIMLAQARDCE